VRVLERALPLWGFVLAAAGASLVAGGLVAVAMAGPNYGGIAFAGLVALATGWLWLRWHDPAGLRTLRAGLALYLLPVLAMTLGAAIALAVPKPVQPQDPKPAQAVETRLAEHRRELAEEARIMSSGGYAEAVAFRARQFGREYAEQSGFTVFVLGLFLVGMWLVQSGAMLQPERHLALFRGLAKVALPAGAVLVLASSLLATHHVPRQNDREWQLAMGLQLLGNLPMLMGYVALLVLAMQHEAW